MNYLYEKVLGKESAGDLKKEIESFKKLSKEENGGIMNYLYEKVLGEASAKDLKKEIESFKELSKEEKGGITNYLYEKVLGKDSAGDLKKEIESFKDLSKPEKGGITNYLYVKVLTEEGAENLKKEIDSFNNIYKEDNGLLKYICGKISNEKGFFDNVQKLIKQSENIMNLFNDPSFKLNEDEKTPLLKTVSYFMNLADRLRIFSLRNTIYSKKYPGSWNNMYNINYIIPSLLFAFGYEKDQLEDPVYRYLVENNGVKPEELGVINN
jgi:hypothetical protein